MLADGPVKAGRKAAKKKPAPTPAPISDVRSSSGKDYGLAKTTAPTPAPISDVRSSSGKDYGLAKTKAYEKKTAAQSSRRQAAKHTVPGSPPSASVEAFMRTFNRHHKAVQASDSPFDLPNLRLNDESFFEDIGSAGEDVAKYFPKLLKDAGADAATGGLATLFGFTDAGKTVSPAGRVLRITAQEGVKDPFGTGVNTLKGVRDMAAAIPAGIVAAIHNPEDIPKQFVDDIGRRYFGSDEQIRDEVRTRGFASYGLDAAGLVTGAGTVVAKPLVKLGRAAAPEGSKAYEFLNAARPKLRTSGGTARAQELADRPLRIVGQRVLDKRRAAKDARLAAAARDGETPADAIRVQAATNGDEVTPYLSRTARKAQRHDVALLKGRRLQLMRSEQFRKIDKTTRKEIAALSKPEREAFYHVAAGILAAEPHAAVLGIQARRAYIEANREASGIGSVKRKTDELRTLDYLEKNAEKAFTPRLSALVQKLRPEHLKVATDDPALTAHQRLLRRYAQQAEHLGIRRGVIDSPEGLRYEQEGTADYIRRIQAAADEKGLERPLYFPSEKYALADNPDFASRTVGGHKAMGSPFKYTGQLFREGRQDTSPEVYLTGLARSIKRKHNWALVADQFDAQTLPGYRNMTMRQLKNKLAREGIDMSSVEFWNPRLYRKALSSPNSKDTSVRNLEAPNRYGDRVDGDEEFQIEQVQDAVYKAQSPPDPGTDEYSRSRGWSVVPKEAHREIHSTINTSGLAAITRRSQRFFQTWPSRILLGANPLWNAFQVGSNILISTGAMGLKHGGPLVALARQARLYHVLDPDSKTRVDALIGEGAGAHGNKVRLGSTAGPVSRKINRVLASPKLDAQARIGGVPVTPSLRQLNPVEAGFRADRFQNAQFRRALLFHSMKDYGEALTPERVKAILDDPEMAEANAEFVSDWLGDYTTYTRFERAAQGFPLTPLFYGYLRHSLSLVFRTLPRDNPLLLEAAMQLGHLQAEQLRELGVEGLPWSSGKFYWEQDGELHEFDLARLNPAMNAVTGLRSPSQLAGIAPPVWGMLVDQITHRSTFYDRPWSIGGDPADPMAKSEDFPAGARARIALDRLLSLSNPYRVASRHTEFGPHGDDSILGDRPTERVMSPRNREERARDREWEAEDRAEAADWLRDLIPLPRVSRDQEIAEARRKAGRTKHKITDFTRARPTIGTGSGPKIGSGRPTIGGG
jgi:hypothetical protein